MTTLIEILRLPVENLAGMLIYAILFMLISGLATITILHFITVPSFLKSGLTGIAVFTGLYLWWELIIF